MFKDKERKSDNNNVAIYLRVSSREQAMFGYGIAAQEEKAESYLQLFEYEVNSVSIYKDEGISAKDMNRPALKRLLNDVKQGKINIIVIYKLDRLARNVINVYEIIKLLMDYNCNLISVMDQLDIYSANGRMLVGILAIIAQWEREVIQERTQDGLLAMVHKGKYPHPYSPFGWNKDTDNKLHVNEEEAAILNVMTDMAIDGYSISEITRHCAEEFNFVRSKDIVKKYLMREYNVGKFFYQGKVYKNIVPKIIDEGRYKKAIQMLEKRLSHWENEKYYFSNKAFCSCGSLLVHKVTMKKKKEYRYYMCESCKKRINQEYILEQTLSQIFNHSKKIKKTKTAITINRRLYYLNKKIEKTYDDFIKGSIDAKTYAFVLSKLNEDKKLYNEKLNAQYISSNEHFQKMSDKQKQDFICGYIKDVVIDMDLLLVVAMHFIDDK